MTVVLFIAAAVVVGGALLAVGLCRAAAAADKAQEGWQ